MKKFFLLVLTITLVLFLSNYTYATEEVPFEGIGNPYESVSITKTQARDYFTPYGDSSYNQTTEEFNLITANGYRRGYIYFNEILNLNYSFDAHFKIKLAQSGSPADGFVIGLGENEIGTVHDASFTQNQIRSLNAQMFVIDTYKNTGQTVNSPNLTLRYTKADSAANNRLYDENGNQVSNSPDAGAVVLTNSYFRNIWVDLSVVYNAQTKTTTFTLNNGTTTHTMSGNLGDRGAQNGLRLFMFSTTGDQHDRIDVRFESMTAYLTSDPITQVQATYNTDETYTFKPTMGAGQVYPMGSTFFIEGLEKAFVIDSNGNVTMPRNLLQRYDEIRNVYVKKRNHGHTAAYAMLVPGYQTETPVLERTIVDNGPMAINLKRADNTLYPANTTVTIEGITQTFTVDQTGNISIPYNLLPEYDTIANLSVKEVSKETSETTTLLLHGRKTIAPTDVAITQDHLGNITVILKRPNGDLYDTTSVVYVLNGNQYTLNDDGAFVIEASNVQNEAQNITVQVQDIQKTISNQYTFEIPGKHDTKASFITDLLAEKQRHIDLINTLENLVDKTTFLNQIDALYETKLQEIEDSLTPDAAQAVVESAIEAFDSVYQAAHLRDAKDNEIARLEAKAQALKTQIDNLTSLDSEERRLQREQIQATKNQAIQAVNNATSIIDVKTAGDEGIIKLENVFLKAAQLNAKKELDNYTLEQEKYIDQLVAVGDDEKVVYKQRQKAVTDAAKAAITLANSQKEVLEIKEQAKEDLRAINLEGSKENAINYIKLEAEKLGGIPLSTELSTILSKHNGLINQKLAPHEVEAQMYLALDEIRLQAAKQTYIGAIEAKAEKIHDDIESLNDLESGRKAYYQSLINDIVESAEAAINNSTNTDDMEDIREAKEKELDAIWTDVQRECKKHELNQAKDGFDMKLEELVGLDPVTKEAYQTALNQAEIDAAANIDARTNVNLMDSEKEAGIDAFERILFDATKENYTNLLATEVARLEGLVDGYNNLTTDQRNEYKAIFHAIKNKANNDFELADNVAELKKIYDDAMNELTNEIGLAENQDGVNLGNTKARFSSDLENRATYFKSTIESMQHLSEQEKQAFYVLVDDQKDAGLLAINAAIEVADMRLAYNKAVEEMLKVVANATLQNEKYDAENQINQRYLQELARLRSIDNIDDELAGFEEELLDKKNAGLQALQDASMTTIALVRASRQQTFNDMGLIYPEAYRKQAENRVMERYTIVSNLISASKELTSTRIDELLQDAIDIIGNLATDLNNKPLQDVDSFADDKIIELNQLLATLRSEERGNLNDEKARLIHDLNTKADAAIAEINQYVNLAPSEKQQFIIDEIEKARNEGIVRINNATSSQDAQDRYQEAVDLIDETRLKAKREDAYGELEKETLYLIGEGKITEEVAKIIVEAFDEIGKETDYDTIDDIVENTKRRLEQQIQEELFLAKEQVRETLTDYARKPITPDMQAIIDAQVDKVTRDNYNDDQIIDNIIIEGKELLDQEKQKMLDDKKQAVKDELEAYADKPISDEVRAIIDQKIDKITEDNYDDDDIITDIIDEGISRIDAYNLSLEKEKALEKLKELYESYKDSEKYLDSALEELKNIYEQAIENIGHATDKNALEPMITDAESAFKSVKIYIIGSGDFDMNDLEIDYITKEDQIIAVIKNSSGMDLGTRVSINLLDLNTENINLILKFIEESKFTNQVQPKMYQNQKVSLLFDISLIDSTGVRNTNFQGTYQVRILLPEHMRGEINHQIIYLKENGIETFDTTRNGNWITFTTTHFSEFYLTVLDTEEKLVTEDNHLDWIIILLSTIILFEVILIFVKRQNNRLRLRSTVLPALFLGLSRDVSIPIIWTLVAIIIILLIYLIYLFLVTPPLQARHTYINHQLHVNNHQENHYYAQNEEKEAKTIDAIDQNEEEIDDSGLKIRYNYSFEARMHQSPLESQARFSELKNYLLSYEGVDVKKSWKYERFMYKGKPILKAWIHGNNLKLYYNLDPKMFVDSKYGIEDVSYAKMHETTPSLFVVNGPRLLEYSKELVDMYLNDLTIQKEIPHVDYTVKFIKRDKLIDMKLVKVNKHK